MHLMHFKSAPSQPPDCWVRTLLCRSTSLSSRITCAGVICPRLCRPSLERFGSSPATHLGWHLPAKIELRHCSAPTPLSQSPSISTPSPRAKAATVSLSTNCSRSLTYQMSVSLCSSALSRSRRIDRRERRKGVAFHCTTRSWLVRMCVYIYSIYTVCVGLRRLLIPAKHLKIIIATKTGSFSQALHK